MANILYTFYYSKPEDRHIWQEMVNVCFDSFRRNLVGIDECRIVIENEASEQRDIFYRHFLRMREWWKAGHNVLYINPDMICVKEVNIFEAGYTGLSMFWQTDPPKTDEFDIQFNGGIMYIPAMTDKAIWKYGNDEYKNTMRTGDVPWATDQTIFNKMLYKQKDREPKDYLDNKLHYLDRTPDLNVISKSDAAIIHYFSTRGLPEALASMKSDLGIPN